MQVPVMAALPNIDVALGPISGEQIAKMSLFWFGPNSGRKTVRSSHKADVYETWQL